MALSMNCAGRIMPCLQLLLLLGLTLNAIDAHWTVRPRRTTTTAVPNATPNTDRHQHVHHWPPLVAPLVAPLAPAKQPEQQDDNLLPNTEAIRLIDNFDQRSPDGHHEFRYELSNGDTRYERTYWLPVGKNLVLARRGYYSVPLPNAQYSTVFYRADHHGYHVDTHTLSGKQPLLPRTLDVPHDMATVKSTPKLKPAAKRNSISVPERNDSQLRQHPDAHAMDIATTTLATQTSPSPRPSPSTSQASTKVKVQAEAEADADGVAVAVAKADDDAVAEVQARPVQNGHNQNGPSTVAKVDDILATKVGTVDADANDDDEIATAAHHDDDDDLDDDDDDDVVVDDNDDVTVSNINEY